jgi:aminodeoxyfutalosine synthase
VLVNVSEDLASRLAEGRRLSDDEIGSLAGTHDIITIGMMADEVRRRLHRTRTTFLRVADVPASPEGATSWPAGAGEVRIVGTPLSRKAAVDRARQVSAQAKGTPVSGFSLADLERLAAGEGVTLRALLEELQAAGLELVADAAFDQLQDPERSVEEVNISGLALARLTIHQLASSDMPALFRRVAELQRRVAVIRAFAPLPRAFNPAVPTTGYDDLKRVALARLIVGNIASIQVDWSLYGPKLAQVALTVGADDVDAVSPEDATGEGRRRAPLEEIRRNIRAAGQEPLERNGRFEILAGAAEGPARAGLPAQEERQERQERG